MCFKLDNGSELFSVQDMQKLKKPASGRMGSRNWVESAPGEAKEAPHDAGGGHSCSGDGQCSCSGRCVRCACAERRARREAESRHGLGL